MTAQEIAAKAKQEAGEPDQTRPGRAYLPDVDIREDADALWLWADMPGVPQNRVAVELDRDVLTIRGEVSLERYDGLRPVYTEYNVGNFFRRFTLPSSGRFDVDGITARMSAGVLEVKIPKSDRARHRQIPVAAG